MSIKGALTYAMKPGLLRRLSGGQGRRAALVLIGVHLAALVILLLSMVLVWLVGLAPIFDRVHWIPAVLATLVFLAVVLGMMMAFGFWGTGANSGQDGGDQYDDDFSPGVAAGLGWLRWLMQIVLIGACTIPLGLIWADMRWRHVEPTPEIKGLPALAESMPIPRDWVRTSGERRDIPFPDEFYVYDQEFDVPESYGFDQLETLMNSSEWATSVGALQDVNCTAEIEYCRAEVAHAGDDPTYVIKAWYATSSIEGYPPSVRLDLTYWVPGTYE